MSDFLTLDLKSPTRDLLLRQAEASGRSLQEEVERILDSWVLAAAAEDAAREQADQIFAQLSGRVYADSAELIREARER